VDHDSAHTVHGDATDLMSSFPDENPNPVLRIAQDGRLLYANRAAEPLVRTLGVGHGGRVPADFLARLAAGASAVPSQSFELACELRTLSILAVPVPGIQAWNVYGTDVTAAKVVEKFPDRNPNPVLRISPDGALIYANSASSAITRALAVVPGELMPPDLMDQIDRHLAGEAGDPILVGGDGQIFELHPVRIPEFRFINLYGTDVTAMHAVTAFPDENPNPVLRADRDGCLAYANPASRSVLAAFGIEVGDPLPDDLLRRLRDVAAGPAPNTMDVEAEGRLYALRVVALPAFESINVYGSDITAAREVEQLLLNILPASIADRLRHGESMIADRFEDMAVLFADVVDFTPFTARRSPMEVVQVLNDVFSIFDRLADGYRLEKIKTIGDAYMVAGGLTPEGGGVDEVADMALDMIAAMHDYRSDTGDRLEIRVGLHVGPAVAGIIGLKKFIYDIWGDTVNTASRLESHGVPARIQVTIQTAARLSDGFCFEPRGPIEIKGKGLVETSFLIGRR
jgi:class 3 adenylate cyclase